MADETDASSGKAVKPGTWKTKASSLWAKLALDVPTVVVMVKGSIPPTIALAMYQSTTVANYYGTQGYLVAIMSILAFCIMPRGIFIQNLALNITAACFAAALNLLALYCAVKARQNTTPVGASPAGYNSSASAVCAIFYIAQIYAVNYLRQARPQFNFSAIVYSIFATVSMTYGVLFPTVAYAQQFLSTLLITVLSGFGLATAVHFVVIPVSSRTVVFKEMTAYLQAITGTLRAHTAYIHSLEEIDLRRTSKSDSEATTIGDKHGKKSKEAEHGPLTNAEALALQKSIEGLVGLHLKIHEDLIPAKREFALGKLESHNLTELWKLFRKVFVPVYGLSTSSDLAQRRAAAASKLRGLHNSSTEGIDAWLERVHFLVKQLRTPCEIMTAEVEQGIKHVLLTLDLAKPPKKQKLTDHESEAKSEPAPGSPGFVAAYRQKLKDYQSSAETTLSSWCEKNGITLPAKFFDDTFRPAPKGESSSRHIESADQRQLFAILYQEFLLWKIGAAVLDLIVYVDTCRDDGALNRTKLIFPGSKTLYKWLKAVFTKEDMADESNLTGDFAAGKTDTIEFGAEFGRDIDPEHLPPTKASERFGDALRKVPAFFRSDSSAFAFRVVAASMSLAILCYVEQTQQFFLNQRLLWALIMISISMTKNSGQTTLTFSLRILGTLIAMIASLVIWYIVDGRVAGVLVFTWLWLAVCFYFIKRFPKLIIVSIISMVTVVLIIGYELEVGKIGVRAIESNGQEAYPTYLLAPYRLATVTAGLFVAFVWTIFPYPVSESTEIRKDLGATLYLMANFYSIIHEIVQTNVKEPQHDDHVVVTHANRLEKARGSVFNKLMLLIKALDSNLAFSKFQIHLGGRFPREDYEELLTIVKRVIRNLTLSGYASTSFSPRSNDIPRDRAVGEDATVRSSNSKSDTEASKWSADFRKLVSSTSTTSHQMTSLLSLLSSSVRNGQRLPPYLQVPATYHELKTLEEIDPDILGSKHILEPEYSAFAVVQLCTEAISEDIERMVTLVKKLVGEMDFTFHAVSTTDPASRSGVSPSSGKAAEQESLSS